MIKFFRTIRQTMLSEGKTVKYLKYAVGEIVLVVIGILIALTINNWNDQKNNAKSEHIYYCRILEDFELDKQRIEELKEKEKNARNEYRSARMDVKNKDKLITKKNF